jgi:peptidoglycan/LPS O-acetylase OafA/YrhL
MFSIQRDSVTRKTSSGWLAQLDGLRGISILMVLTAHVFAPAWKNMRGDYGVTVFFVLSGFLITRLLLQEERDTGEISLPAFYVRRAFRLFPVYYLILAVYCVLILGMGIYPEARQKFAYALPWYLIYFQEIPFFSQPEAPPPFYQSWSLGIEEKFYMIWPFVAFRLLRNRNARMALAAGAAVFFSSARLVHQARYIFPYAAICVGCLFALLYDEPGIRSRLESWVSSWRAPLVFLSWPILHLVIAWRSLPFALRLFADLAYPLSIALVILVTLCSVRFASVFSVAPLTLLGRYSYCMYLIHVLVRRAAERILNVHTGEGNGLLVFLLMLLFSTAGAAILHYTIESRFRELGRRIASSWKSKEKVSNHPQPALAVEDGA